jgi:hypothetical protein
MQIASIQGGEAAYAPGRVIKEWPLSADRFDNRECRFNHVGTGQCLSELLRHLVECVNEETDCQRNGSRLVYECRESLTFSGTPGNLYFALDPNYTGGMTYDENWISAK